jgi:hypothetical protein
MRLFKGIITRRRLGDSLSYLPLCVLLFAIFWTSSVTAEKTAADYFVHSLPGQPDGPLLKIHAG